MKSFTWINIFTLSALVCALFAVEATAQVHTLKDSGIVRFSRHLINKKLHEENIRLLQIHAAAADTSRVLSRLKAYSYYKTGNTDSALQVLNNFNTQEASLFKLYLKTRADLKTDTFFVECDAKLYPHCFDLLKVSLLKNRRFEEYGNWFYQQKTGALNFDDKFTQYTAVKRKSGFLAATLSAVIPGTGKMYAGKPGEGLSALITNLILGWQFYDHYNHLGFRSVRTIAYGALFSTFYLGNIYGSAISVSVYKNQQYEVLDNSIMLDVSVPVERLFSR